MAKVVYNNAKNTSTGYNSFEFNYGYHSKVFFEKDVNSHSRFCFADKLAKKLEKLIEVCYQNLLYAREL